MKSFYIVSLLAFSSITAFAEGDLVNYPAVSGPGKGKHVVLIAGDEEYRSEESMPMLGKILSQRQGFNCTVLFSVGADGRSTRMRAPR